MINDPQVPNGFSKALSKADPGGEHAAPAGAFGRTALASLLIMAATGALAITSLVPANKGATASPVVPIQAAVPPALPLYAGELVPFSFGYLVFEEGSASGVPHGFGPLPSGHRTTAR